MQEGCEVSHVIIVRLVPPMPVTHHHERQVIYCLMELARMALRFGLEPPSLISMETEIDSQASGTTSQASDTTLQEDEEQLSGALPAAAADTAELCASEGPNKTQPPSKRLQDSSLLDLEVIVLVGLCETFELVNSITSTEFSHCFQKFKKINLPVSPVNNIMQ